MTVESVTAATREVTDEMVEVASKAYAEATGYYVEFHKGLWSESANSIRKGIRAALEAARDMPAAELDNRERW